MYYKREIQVFSCWMKQIKRLASIAFVIVVVAIVILAIRNDNHFNAARVKEASELEKRDLIACERLDSIRLLVKDIKEDVDSIRSTQKKAIEIEHVSNKAVQQSLDKIQKVQQQLPNLSR